MGGGGVQSGWSPSGCVQRVEVIEKDRAVVPVGNQTYRPRYQIGP